MSYHIRFPLLVLVLSLWASDLRAQNIEQGSAAIQLGNIKQQLRYPDSALMSLRSLQPETLGDSLQSEYFRLMGSAFFYKGITDSAIIYFTSSMAVLDQEACNDHFSLVANGLAVVLQRAELYEEAIDNYTKALSCAEMQGDKVLKLKILTNLSILNREIGNTEQSWFYLKKAFQLSKERPSMTSMAALFNSKGQLFLISKELDSAKVAFNQSLALRTDGDRSGRAICLNNLGYVNSLQKNNLEALEYYTMASEIRHKIGDMAGNASIFINMANIYLDMGELAEASQYFQNAQILNERVKSPSLSGRVILGNASLQEKKGNLKESVALYEEYIDLKDSLLDFRSMDKLAASPYKIALLEAENKVKRIEQEEEERKEVVQRQRWVNLGLGIGLALFIGLVSLLVYQLKMLSNLRKALTDERDVATENAEMRRQTLNVVVHELKTPMNAIISLTDLILREQDPKEIKSMTEVLRKSSQRLLNTTNNVLTYSRIEDGSVQLVNHTESLSEVLQEICSVLEPHAKSKNLDFHLAIEEDISIKTDRAILEIILMNLIGNAIKYTEIGGVEVVLESNAHKAFVYVRDTGMGISTEEKSRIFEPFFQSDERPTKGREGAGLGLSISKYYAEFLGAEIKVESTLGEGSEFILILDRQA